METDRAGRVALTYFAAEDQRVEERGCYEARAGVEVKGAQVSDEKEGEPGGVELACGG